MELLTKIAAVDLTSSMVESSLVINSLITKRIDTCQLDIRDTTGSISVANWQEIIISNTGESTRYFAGYITSVRHDIDGITKVFRCKCQDYTVLLDRVIVNTSYSDKTGGFMLNDLFTTYLPEIDAATYVNAGGVTFDKIVFNRVTLRAVVEQIAAENNWDWYVDYDKNLRVFPKETNLAPFGISTSPDNSTTYAAERLAYKKESLTIVNRVTVVGGYYLSADSTWDEIPASGTQKEILLPYVLEPEDGQTQIRIDHNTGNDGAPTWTANTVGIDNIDALGVAGVDVLFNRDEKLLVFETAPSELDKAVRVRARYRVPVLVRVRSEVSYDTYGRWFDGKIVNQSIVTRNAAKLAGKALLAEQALARESGTFGISDRDGLVAGQKINIVDPLRGVNGDYLINQVQTRILGGDKCVYKVSFGVYNPDLVDMLILLKAATARHEDVRDDEVLNELFEELETLVLSETTDSHQDAFPPAVSRFIATAPAQGVTHHVRHEALALAETPTNPYQEKQTYLWGETGNYPYTYPIHYAGQGTKWDFFTWG